MSPTFRRLEVTKLEELAALVAENVEGIELGLKVIDGHLLLGQAAIDLVGLDAKGSLVLIALDFTADEGLLLRGMDAYSWCLEYPDTIGRLYPAAEISPARPPRILFIVERLTDAFVRRIRQLCFHDVDCLEFRHLEVNGASALYFDPVERIRQADGALEEPAEVESPIRETPGVWEGAAPDPVPAPVEPEPTTEPEVAEPEVDWPPAASLVAPANDILEGVAASVVSVVDEPREEALASMAWAEPVAEPAQPEVEDEAPEEAARPAEPVTPMADTGSKTEWQAFLGALGVEVSTPEAVPTGEAESTPPPVAAPSAGHTAFFAKPVNGEPAASGPTVPPAPKPSARKPAILVVDDAGPVVSLCLSVLQTLRCSIRTANRGATALELVAKEPFDLVLVDYMMPGMNGFDVLGQVRKIRPEMAGILMTAYGTQDIINDATRLGFNAILRKPFTPTELRAAVEKVLAGTDVALPGSTTRPARIG